MTEWRRDVARFNFRLGEWRFRVVKVPALVFAGRYLDLPSDPWASLPARSELPPDVGAVFIASHPVTARPPRMTAGEGWVVYIPRTYRRFRAELTGTFEGYLKDNFSGKTRGTLSKKVRKYKQEAGDGPVYRRFSREDEVEEFLALASPLADRTYQAKLFHNALPSGPAFTAEAKALARLDRFRAFLLFYKGKPAAYLYTPSDAHDDLEYAFVGFEADLAGLSPGTVLQYLAFEDLFAEKRFKTFDFVEGEGAHKELFSTHHLLCADVFALPDGAKARALVATHAAWEGGQLKLREMAEQAGVKDKLKRFIRRASVRSPWGTPPAPPA